MAAPGVIVKKNEAALRRIIDAAAQLAKSLDIEIPEIPTQGRDLDWLHMSQMEAIADALDAINNRINIPGEEAETADTIVATDTADNDTMLVREQDGAFVQDLPDAPDYESMTKAELLELAGASGVKATERMNKSDIINLLTKADDDGNTANG